MYWVKGNIFERNRFVATWTSLYEIFRKTESRSAAAFSSYLSSFFFFFFRTCFSCISLCMCSLSLHRNTCPNTFWALTYYIFFTVFSFLPCSTIYCISDCIIAPYLILTWVCVCVCVCVSVPVSVVQIYSNAGYFAYDAMRLSEINKSRAHQNYSFEAVYVVNIVGYAVRRAIQLLPKHIAEAKSWRALFGCCTSFVL